MRLLIKGLNPLKIQARFKLEVSSEFYNAKSREIWRLHQKGFLSTLNLSAILPSLEHFGQQKGCVFYSLRPYLSVILAMHNDVQIQRVFHVP
jgi:hypothetical protein